MTVGIADAGPLIHRGEIGGLGLLKLFDSLLVPGEVWREAAQERRLTVEQLTSVGNLIRHPVELADVQAFIRSRNLEHLHAGESECLFLCHREEIPLLLTDDLAVRDAATGLGITPVGSLGIVVRSFRVGHIGLSEAERYILDLQRVSSLFVTGALVDMVLEQLRKPAV